MGRWRACATSSVKRREECLLAWQSCPEVQEVRDSNECSFTLSRVVNLWWNVPLLLDPTATPPTPAKSAGETAAANGGNAPAHSATPSTASSSSSASKPSGTCGYLDVGTLFCLSVCLSPLSLSFSLAQAPPDLVGFLLMKKKMCLPTERGAILMSRLHCPLPMYWIYSFTISHKCTC